MVGLQCPAPNYWFSLPSFIFHPGNQDRYSRIQMPWHSICFFHICSYDFPLTHSYICILLLVAALGDLFGFHYLASFFSKEIRTGIAEYRRHDTVYVLLHICSYDFPLTHSYICILLLVAGLGDLFCNLFVMWYIPCFVWFCPQLTLSTEARKLDRKKVSWSENKTTSNRITFHLSFIIHVSISAIGSEFLLHTFDTIHLGFFDCLLYILTIYHETWASKPTAALLQAHCTTVQGNWKGRAVGILAVKMA